MRRNERATILIVDDDSSHLAVLKTVTKSWGYEIETADDGAKAVEMVRERPFDLVLMDVRMTVMGGIEALTLIKEYNPAIPVLIMTAYSSVESAVQAIKAGAYDYLTKPLDFDLVQMTIERALEHTNLKKENIDLKERLAGAFALKSIIGKSPPMKDLIELIVMVAPTEATALITGESGTGKELIAKSIHFSSVRKDDPLVIVNCAALTETLLESELFGHEKGAFTGADRKRLGRFMQAHKGTIFLDEIGEMSPSMQAKLLRVIQEREIQRVGSDETIPVDVRILAATNRDLEKEVSSGTFREDLFYRLNVVTLRIPSLRERREDIPLLAQHFLEKYAKQNRKRIKGYTPLAIDMLLKYSWPGNVRELENAVERAVVLLPGDFVSEKELPLNIVEAYGQTDAPTVEPEQVMQTGPLEEIEKRAILATLEATNGNKSAAARKLGITRKTLHKKLVKYGED